MEFILLVLVDAGLGVITGKLAEKKGYEFWKWWFYGFLVFIVAFIHAAFILQDKNVPQAPIAQATQSVQAGVENYVSVEPQKTTNTAKNLVEELKSYKELLDQGVLTQEEFDAKKKEILGL